MCLLKFSLNTGSIRVKFEKTHRKNSCVNSGRLFSSCSLILPGIVRFPKCKASFSITFPYFFIREWTNFHHSKKYPLHFEIVRGIFSFHQNIKTQEKTFGVPKQNLNLCLTPELFSLQFHSGIIGHCDNVACAICCGIFS